MILPTIPTDNLYKFMALSGLTLLILSVAAPEFLKYKLRVDEYHASTDRKILDIDIENNYERIEKIKVKMDIVQQKQSGIASPEEVEDLLNKAFKANTENRKLEVKYEEYSRLIEYKKGIYEMLKTYQYVGAFFGVALGFLGFIFWYLRVQRKSDLAEPS